MNPLINKYSRLLYKDEKENYVEEKAFYNVILQEDFFMRSL